MTEVLFLPLVMIDLTPIWGEKPKEDAPGAWVTWVSVPEALCQLWSLNSPERLVASRPRSGWLAARCIQTASGVRNRCFQGAWRSNDNILSIVRFLPSKEERSVE